MLIRKCDICKKEIKKGDQEIVVMMGWPQFSFCARCGKPILGFSRNVNFSPHQTRADNSDREKLGVAID